MKFLYPKPNIITHTFISVERGVSIAFPSRIEDLEKFDYPTLKKGTGVCVIRENVGLRQQWALVKAISKEDKNEEFFDKEFYVLMEFLENIGTKKTYSANSDRQFQIDPRAEEIDPNLQEIFVPYVDKRNGFLSVRIQVDQERIVDNVFFEKTVQEVFYEGMKILLEYKKYLGDNDTISNFVNQFYTFGFVNNDLDLTANRACEPISFTVSIPLNFPDNITEIQEPVRDIPVRTITFNSNDFKYKIDSLLSIITSRAGDILRYTYPDKVIEGFIIDIELASIKRFAVALNDFLNSINYPLATKKQIIYSFGLDSEYKLVSIAISENGNELKPLSNAIVSRAKLQSAINSQRIFYYFSNLNGMSLDVVSTPIETFLTKYVKYPDAKLAAPTIIINNKVLPQDKVKQYNEAITRNTEECVTLGDISSPVNDTVALGENLFHFFVERKNEEELRKKRKTTIETLQAELAFIKTDRPDHTDPKDIEERGAELKLLIEEEIADLDSKTAGAFKKINEIDEFEQDEQKKKGKEDAIAQIKRKYAGNINTLIYIINRTNLNKFLFQQYLCIIQGIDPNTTEGRLLRDGVPEEVVRYFYYIYKNRSLTGAAFARALISGLPLDLNLFCSNNKALIYFIKGLKTLVQELNRTGLPIFKSFFAPARVVEIEEPYRAFQEAIILSVEKTVTDLLFQYIKDILETSCEQDFLQTNSENFKDPFNTHIPLAPGFGGSQNNDSGIVRENRTNVLNELFPLVVQRQYGFDINFQINLIDRLINDIRCYLSLTEQVDLLKGKPTPLVESIIKNIIKLKYSNPPNDLRFLLSDTGKLKLFFEKLGLTVDPEYLNVATEVVYNSLSPSDLCSPQQLEARKEILNNKLPKDLGILEQQLVNREIKAKRIFDNITNVAEVPYNPFCPDNGFADVETATNTLLQTFLDNARSVFSETLTLFNSEANKIPSVFTEEKDIWRLKKEEDFSKRPFGTVTYPVFYENISYNFTSSWNSSIQFLNQQSVQEQVARLFNIDFLSAADLAEAYINNNIVLNKKFKTALNVYGLADVYVPQGDKENLSVVCEKANFSSTFSEDLQSFIKNPLSGIYGEIIYVDRTFESKTDRGETNPSDLQDLENENKPSSEGGSALGRELNSKKFFITITADIDLPSSENTDVVEFKLIYKDPDDGKFRVQKEVVWEGVFPDERVRNSSVDGEQIDAWSSENFVNNFIDHFSENETDQYVPRPFSQKQGVRYFGDSVTDRYNDVFDAGFGDNPFFNISGLSNKSRFVINYIFENYFKEEIKKIINFEQLRETLIKFERMGLFAMDTAAENILFDKDIDKLEQDRESSIEIERKLLEQVNKLSENPSAINTNYINTINVTTGSSKNGEIALAYKNYLTFNQKGLKPESLRAAENFVNFTNTTSFSIGGGLSDSTPTAYAFTVSNTENYYDFLLKNSKRYFKNVINYSDFTALKKEDSLFGTNVSETIRSESGWNEALEDENTEITYSKVNDPFRQNVEKLSLLKFPIDDRFKACNINPHYLNLDYFLQIAFNNAKDDICEGINGLPEDIIEEIAVNLTFRSYVADLLIKIAPMLSLLTEKELMTMFQDDTYVEIIAKFMLRDMEIYGPNIGKEQDDFTDILTEPITFGIKSEKLYISYFNKAANKIFKKMVARRGTGRASFIFNRDGNAFNYFIRREIHYFIKYSLSKGVFLASQYSPYDYENLISWVNYTKNKSETKSNNFIVLFNLFDKKYGANYDSRALLNVPENIRRETLTAIFKPQYQRYLALMLMGCTVDNTKRSIFYATKQELAQILMSVTTLQEGEQESLNNTLFPDQQDLVNYLSSLSTASDAALTVTLKPQYSKYLFYFLEQSLYSTRNILLNVAESSDPNILLTRRIGKALAFVQNLSWSIIPQQERSKLINESTNLGQKILWKRLEEGKNITPDLILSSGLLAGGLIRTPIGSRYIILDTIAEGIWLVKAIQELRQQANLSASQDPCEPTEAATEPETFVCSPEKRKGLIDELNGLEAPPRNVLDTIATSAGLFPAPSTVNIDVNLDPTLPKIP